MMDQSSELESNGVNKFWFSLSLDEQMRGKEGLDDEIRERFLNLYEAAKSKKLDSWRHEPDSCLSLIIVVDQFPRNMFRGTPRAFESDEYALELAQFAIDQNYLKRLRHDRLMWILLPLQHVESLDTNKQCLELWRSYISENDRGVQMTKKHIAILEKFGRYPHRNMALGRVSSHEELQYLENGNLSSFEVSQLRAAERRQSATALTA